MDNLKITQTKFGMFKPMSKEERAGRQRNSAYADD